MKTIKQIVSPRPFFSFFLFFWNKDFSTGEEHENETRQNKIIFTQKITLVNRQNEDDDVNASFVCSTCKARGMPWF